MNDPGLDRWKAVDAIFSEALEVPLAERDAWLTLRCGDDADLCEQVRSLLDAAAFTGFLGTDAEASVVRALSTALDESAGRSGSVIGAYRLAELIGRGGMADVYAADRIDGAFRQRVAIKVQRRGLDTDDVLARFRAEREILSGLNHPNVARILDGGATDDGLPYLVMEYVDGVPITEYCENNALPLRRRLELFIQVARAVQRAHAALVVHRDIKPSNVLVTDEGEVKLLDFGIAKLLDPTALPGEAPLTRTGHRPLTPRYASPEQVRGDAITTASDIYQLGLLLYQLLTGGLPFDDLGERGRKLEDAITSTRPLRPSEYAIARAGLGDATAPLPRRLRGDLDTIVLATLRKEPERRYPSAHELAEDLRRHLEGRPISARRDSRLYRMRKFAQRNPWAGPTLVATAAGVGLYIATLSRHGREMEAQRNAARLEAEKARATQQFLVGLFQSADPFSPVPESRRDIRVSEVMEEGARRANTEFAAQPEVRGLLLGTIGDVFVGLGDPGRALELREAAFEAARSTYGVASREAATAKRKMIDPMIQLHRQRIEPGMPALLLAMDALADVRDAYGHAHPEAARTEIALAEALMFSRTQVPDTVPVGEILARHALDLLGRVDPSDVVAPDRARGLLTLTRTLSSYGLGRDADAAPVAEEAVAAFASAYGDDHPRTWSMRLWQARTVPDPVSADSLRRAAIDAFERELGPHHDVTIRALEVHAVDLNRRGAYEQATEMYRAVVERRLARGDDPDVSWYSNAMRRVGDAALPAGLAAEAEAAFRSSLETEVAAGHAGPRIAALRIRRAWALDELERPAEAIREALRARQEAGDGGASPLYECVLARVLRSGGRNAEADSVTTLATNQLAESGYPVRDFHPCWGITTS